MQKCIKEDLGKETKEIFTDNNYDITKLDVNRLFRYIDRFTLEDTH